MPKLSLQILSKQELQAVWWVQRVRDTLQGGQMTPEEFEPLGYFMGWRKGLNPDFWVSFDGTVSHGAVHEKTSLTPAECYEALERLVEKGWEPELCHKTFKGVAGWELAIFPPGGGYKAKASSGWHSAIHEAIEAALLALIAAEGGRG